MRCTGPYCFQWPAALSSWNRLWALNRCIPSLPLVRFGWPGIGNKFDSWHPSHEGLLCILHLIAWLSRTEGVQDRTVDSHFEKQTDALGTHHYSQHTNPHSKEWALFMTTLWSFHSHTLSIPGSHLAMEHPHVAAKVSVLLDPYCWYRKSTAYCFGKEPICHWGGEMWDRSLQDRGQLYKWLVVDAGIAHGEGAVEMVRQVVHWTVNRIYCLLDWVQICWL